MGRHYKLCANFKGLQNPELPTDEKGNLILAITFHDHRELHREWWPNGIVVDDPSGQEIKIHGPEALPTILFTVPMPDETRSPGFSMPGMFIRLEPGTISCVYNCEELVLDQ